MPISLDYRTGSKELEPLFRSYGIQVEVRKLNFGDLAFEGNGPHGRCAIVLERKRIEDLIASMQSKRLSGHQLPGMADEYDYCYLLVEGLWRAGQDGGFEVGRAHFGQDGFGGRWQQNHGKSLLYRSVDNYLATLELHAGVIYRRTLTPEETVAVVVDLYHWWAKKWGEHSSHLGVYAPAVAKQGKTRLNLTRRKVSQCEAMLMQLPGLDSKAQAAAEHFGSIKNMGEALAHPQESDWCAIKGIGKVTAKELVRVINAAV